MTDENVGALYIDGAPVKSGLPKNIIGDDLYVGDNYRLTLPRKVIENGKSRYTKCVLKDLCLWMGPCQFFFWYDTDYTIYM